MLSDDISHFDKKLLNSWGDFGLLFIAGNLIEIHIEAERSKGTCALPVAWLSLADGCGSYPVAFLIGIFSLLERELFFFLFLLI